MAGCGQSSNINLDPQAIIAPFEEAANIIKAKPATISWGKTRWHTSFQFFPASGKPSWEVSAVCRQHLRTGLCTLLHADRGKRWNSTSTTYCRSTMTIHKRHPRNQHDCPLQCHRHPLTRRHTRRSSHDRLLDFGAPNILFAGFLTCFASIIPMVGTALVWFPIAVYMALIGNWVQAIGLAIYGGAVISQLDNLIRFIIQKKWQTFIRLSLSSEL